MDVDISAVEVVLKNLERSFDDTEGLMDELGHFLQLSILDRTSKGIDVEGLPFVPYSKSYKRVREEEGLPVDHVDLFFGGSMLSSLTYEKAKNDVRLFFMNTPHKEKKRKKAVKKESFSSLTNAELAYYNNELREFFAISSSEIKKIKKMVREYFSRRIG